MQAIVSVTELMPVAAAGTPHSQSKPSQGACTDIFMIEQAFSLQNKDPYSSKAWILTAQTLFPNNFNVQFEAYKLGKEENNYIEAAKCFERCHAHCDTITPDTQKFWNEVNALVSVLRLTTETEMSPPQEFYMNMFRYVSYEVQHKILLLTVNFTENNLNQCKLLLVILRRFPKATLTHSAQLLDMMTRGMKQNPVPYQDMLLNEVLPLLYIKNPDLSPNVVCPLLTLSMEHYLHLIMDNETRNDADMHWKKMFKTLMLCASILRWDTFLPFNKAWGHSIYWEKLIHIVALNPPGCPQVLFYATTLFIYSLYSYLKGCNTRPDDTDTTNHILVEGFTEWKLERADHSIEPPLISPTTQSSKEISQAFAHAAQCWQLLNTEHYQRDLSKLLLNLPLASWVSRFLFDLAIYFGHQEEAKKLMAEINVNSSLVHNLQLLSLNLLQDNITVQGYECIFKIIAELPATPGQHLENLTVRVPRHMIFIPLTQKALVQYCNRALLTFLSRKLYEPNVSDRLLGDLVVLLQLEYPRSTLLTEQIFNMIASRRSFCYPLFSVYIVLADFIEEFIHILTTMGEDFYINVLPTQSPTLPNVRRSVIARAGDKALRDECMVVIRQQLSRSGENLTTLIANFISIYGSESSNFL